jgi:hypothetical protein
MKLARCDECACEADIDRWETLPDDWFVVEQNSANEGNRAWFFCSPSCLTAYVLLRGLYPYQRS